MNKLPAEVKVGNRVYQCGDLQQPNHALNGVCHVEEGVIYVAKDLQKDFHLEIAVHELLHAIWANYNIQDEDDEERTVSQLATGLTQVLLDNPELLKYIQSQVK